MIDIIFLIVGLLIAYFAGFRQGWVMREQQALQLWNSFAERMHMEATHNHVHMTITQEGPTFLLHNAKTGEFLGQGKDFEELKSTLNKRFPDKIFTASPQDLAKLEK